MKKVSINKDLKCDALYHMNECQKFKKQLIGDSKPLIIANINGFEIAICDNNKFIELINNEIKQTELCLEGSPNEFMEFMNCT